MLEWPPQSPNLNPIEHLWNEVDKRLRLSGTSPTCEDDLWEKIHVVWHNMKWNIYRSSFAQCQQGWIIFLQLRVDTHVGRLVDVPSATY